MPKYFGTEEALRKLKRFFSLEYDLVRHAIGYMPHIPIYMDKCDFAHHMHDDLKRCRSLRERINDFGIVTPEKQLDANWTNLARHLLTAPDDNYFFAALYRVIKPEQAKAYRQYVESTLRLNDAPTVEAIEDHLYKLERHIAWGKQRVEHGAISADEEKKIELFEAEIRSHFEALGGLYQGDVTDAHGQIAEFPEYRIPAEMKLESRFVWRSAERINEGAYQSDTEHPAHHSYTHFTELPVIDICATIVYEGRHMPFEYIANFTRQTWDEVRHSRMGFSRLLSMGIDPYQTPIPLGHYISYCDVPVMERIAALTQVGEACSFTPKRAWTQMALDHHDPLTALEHDYDIVDEKTHVKFGARWLKEMMAINKEQRTQHQIIQDAEYRVREVMNEVKKQKGEKWSEDIGPRFESCQTTDSDLNLAPKIIIA